MVRPRKQTGGYEFGGFYQSGSQYGEWQTADNVKIWGTECCRGWPGLQGFSRRNLYYVKKFYAFFKQLSDAGIIVPPSGAQIDPAIVPRGEAQTIPWIVRKIAGQLPWSHIKIIPVDSLLKSDADNPTIGILLCRHKNKIETEFALRDINKPMGISEFTLTEVLPDELKGSMPTVEEIEAEMSGELNIECKPISSH